MNEGNSSAPPVTAWQGGSAGYYPSALRRPGRRRRMDAANGRSRTAPWTDRSVAEAIGKTCAGVAGSTVGRWPNPRLQRTRPRLRFLRNLNGSGWGPCR
jgi:hypothetical protein